MKRYWLLLAAALAVALLGAGGALAQRHPVKGHKTRRAAPVAHAGESRSLFPRFAPRLDRWLLALAKSSQKPKPPHKPPPEAKVKPTPAHRKAPERQPLPRHPVTTTTLSIYEHNVRPRVLRKQGCSAARRHENGVVILDFGKPAYMHGGYGTILFSGRFAPNRRITSAAFGYARGYVSCLPDGSTASIELARGTSNYDPAVSSAYAAGVRWARETNRLGRMLDRTGLAANVEAAAADDAEPAWDRSFHQTREFFHGFRAATHGHTLFNYGSLDGGVGAVWSARQAWYVSGGLRHTKALPEIYNSTMAREWAELARIAHGRYHRGIHFAGVMTQGTAGCNCGLRPPEAHRALAQALGAQGIGHVPLPEGGTNIVG